LADTLINRHPDTETLIDVAKLAEHTVRFFNHTRNGYAFLFELWFRPGGQSG
jgi:phosphotransacetylase